MPGTGRPRLYDTAVPCASCGRIDGPPRFKGGPPARRTGRSFGIDGALCSPCYLVSLRSGEDDLEDREPSPAERARLDRRIALFLAIQGRARVGASIFGARHEIRETANA